jgi:hypothetical protein
MHGTRQRRPAAAPAFTKLLISALRRPAASRQRGRLLLVATVEAVKNVHPPADSRAGLSRQRGASRMSRGRGLRRGRFGVIIPRLSIAPSRRRRESPVFSQVRQDPPPRLQGGASPWQGLRDLQEQPALQGASALSQGLSVVNDKGRESGPFLLGPRRESGPFLLGPRRESGPLLLEPRRERGPSSRHRRPRTAGGPRYAWIRHGPFARIAAGRFRPDLE